MIGAATGATPLIAPIIASVFANSLPVNISVATEREITIPPAPAIPCSKRSIANISIVGAKMQPIVEMIKRYRTATSRQRKKEHKSNPHYLIFDMKPRTRIQKEVVRLSSGLPELTDKQKAHAFEHCFKHHAYRTKGGTITCSECGHRWKGGHTLAETICGCSCPHCGKELEILDTRKRVFRGSAYYEIITTRKGYQVLRYFMVGATYKVGQKAEYSIREVVQWWIAPNGKTEVIARLRAMHTMYYDLWTEWSDMDLRSNKMLKAYNIDAYKTYPAMRIIPELRRNGFKGAFHELTPYEFFTAILTDSKKETLLKAGQTEMFRYAVISNVNLHEYWNSIKICIRNGYHIADASMWCDLVRLLRHFGKDTHCPKYVCPTDLKKAHDRLVRKREEQIERERAEQRREQLVKDEKNYLKSKGKFFGLVFTDNLILVKVIESVAEMQLEGKLMHHCVGSYHKRTDSLILSATIDGKRIETVEVSLTTFKVVQSRGVCNSNTEYHDRIISLVESNAELIRKRMSA